MNATVPHTQSGFTSTMAGEDHASRARRVLTESGFPNQGDLIESPCWIWRPAWMTAPYSVDLRERALARKEAGETNREIAAALRISPSCVSKWTKRKRETGSLAPR